MLNIRKLKPISVQSWTYLQPYTPFQFLLSECLLEHRHLEAVQAVEHLLTALLQFSDVKLLSIPLLLL